MATKQADPKTETPAAQERPQKEERPRRDLASWFKLGDFHRATQEWAIA